MAQSLHRTPSSVFSRRALPDATTAAWCAQPLSSPARRASVTGVFPSGHTTARVPPASPHDATSADFRKNIGRTGGLSRAVSGEASVRADHYVARDYSIVRCHFGSSLHRAPSCFVARTTCSGPAVAAVPRQRHWRAHLPTHTRRSPASGGSAFHTSYYDLPSRDDFGHIWAAGCAPSSKAYDSEPCSTSGGPPSRPDYEDGERAASWRSGPHKKWHRHGQTSPRRSTGSTSTG